MHLPSPLKSTLKAQPDVNINSTHDTDNRLGIPKRAFRGRADRAGPKVALKTKEVRNDPKALLDIADTIREDACFPIDDPDFQLKLKQVARKLMPSRACAFWLVPCMNSPGKPEAKTAIPLRPSQLGSKSWPWRGLGFSFLLSKS